MRIAALLLIVVVICGRIEPALANNTQLASENQKLEQVRARIKKVISSIQNKQKERGGLQNELRNIEKSLSQQNRRIKKLNQESKALQGRLRVAKNKQRDLTQALSVHRTRLAGQIRSAYLNGNQENLKLLLNQQDPSVLARVLKYYQYLNDARVKTIAETQKTLSELQQVTTDIQQKNEKLTALKKEHETERKRYAQQREERQSILVALDKQISQEQQQIEKLRADAARIQELIASLTGIFADIPDNVVDKRRFSEQRGVLSWPAIGKFKNRFGAARGGGGLRWQGVQIAAASGAEVKAVAHGRVAFADWLAGFGLLLIIDHREGYMTLYGSNSTLYKEAGDWVNAGEIIANVGDTGGKVDSALYFEIRHQGKPIDPVAWLRKGN